MVKSELASLFLKLGYVQGLFGSTRCDHSPMGVIIEIFFALMRIAWQFINFILWQLWEGV